MKRRSCLVKRFFMPVTAVTAYGKKTEQLKSVQQTNLIILFFLNYHVNSKKP